MPRLATESYGTGDQSWLGSTDSINHARSVAPDPAMFTLAAYPDGVPSGTPLGRITATKLFGPYTGDSTDEVVTLTEGGAGLTSWTATFGGQTTASLDDDATAAQVQAALEALSTIGAGNVAVTGTTAPIALTVTFQGDLANTNVGAITTTPTGGTGTVDVAVVTAGGADASSDGREILAGFLLTDQKAPADGSWPMIDDGRIKVANLPIPFAATGHNTTGQFRFVEGSDS